MVAAIAVNTELLVFEAEFTVRFDLLEPAAPRVTMAALSKGGVCGGESKEEDDEMFPLEPILPFGSPAFWLVALPWLVAFRLAKCFPASFLAEKEPVEAGMVALRTLLRIKILSVRVSRFLFSSIV